MIWIVIVIIFSLLLALSNQMELEACSDIITKQEAIEILEDSIYSHQWYIDRPQDIEPGSDLYGGTVAFHQRCIDEYEQVIWYIKEN